MIMFRVICILIIVLSNLVYADFMINEDNKNDLNNLKGKWKITLQEEFDIDKIDSMPDVNVPQQLKSQKLNKVGTIWYYTTVSMNLEYKNDMILLLAQVDDEEEVFFNNVKIGETKAVRYSEKQSKSKYDMKRYYIINKDVINFNGTNELKVKVNNLSGDGGIYGSNISIIPAKTFFKEYLYKKVSVMEFKDWIYIGIVGIALYLFFYNLIFFLFKRSYLKLYLSILAANFAFFIFEKISTRTIFFNISDDIFEQLVFANVIISFFFFNMFIKEMIKLKSNKIFISIQVLNGIFLTTLLASSSEYRYYIFYAWTVLLLGQLLYCADLMWKSDFSRKWVILTGIAVWILSVIHDVLHNLQIWSILPGNATAVGFIVLMISISINSVLESLDISEDLKRLNEDLVSSLESREKEIKSIQQELIRKDKMVMLAGMGAETIHEVKNSVAPILTMIQMTKVDIEDYFESHEEVLKEELQENIATIETAAKQANFILMSFLNYSRSDTGEKREYDVCSSLDMSLNFLKRKIKMDNIKLIVEKDKDKYYILGEKGKIAQVFTNIILNACDAMVEEGQLNRKISIRLNSVGDNVNIEIEDNGPGIPEKVLGRIFEPFYTTKEEGKGTGLGMSVSLAIIKEINGDIRVESIPGQGAKFTIIIPEIQN